MYFVQAMAVLVLGIIMIQAIWLFPICGYFHKKFRNLFLSNVFDRKGCYLLMFIQLTVKPIIEAVIHSLFFDSPTAQLFCLCCSSGLFLFIFFAFELRLHIFKSKLIFYSEIVIELLVVGLNFLIYWKYYAGLDQ